MPNTVNMAKGRTNCARQGKAVVFQAYLVVECVNLPVGIIAATGRWRNCHTAIYRRSWE
jgi:hypothetical protein